MALTIGAQLERNETSNNRDSENRDYTVYGLTLKAAHTEYSVYVWGEIHTTVEFTQQTATTALGNNSPSICLYQRPTYDEEAQVTADIRRR
jgi:hypothetical protein